MKRIIYWAFEGNEGTGKSTLSKEFAIKCGATWTYEPNGETAKTKFLRDLALTKDDDVPKMAREHLHLANRLIHHHSYVIPLIKSSSTVVSDRSFLSGMVYANLNGLCFERFLEMSRISGIDTYPDVIIYCRNKERRIVKNKDDIYDNASESTLSKIDKIFEEAVKFVKTNSILHNIKVIEFDNDFHKSVEDNLDTLISQIKKECLNEP